MNWRKNGKRVLVAALLLGLLVITFSCVYRGRAQRLVRNEAIQFTDASTGKGIQNVLVIPYYSSFDGLAVTPEGPNRGTQHGYLAAPFIYRAGTPFSPNQPKSTGVFWGPLYTGKEIILERVIVVAAGHRRQWFSDLWSAASQQRRVRLNPISPQASSRELQTALVSLEKDKLSTPEERSFWELTSSTPIGVRFNPTERELVRSFIREALQGLTKSP